MMHTANGTVARRLLVVPQAHRGSLVMSQGKQGASREDPSSDLISNHSNPPLSLCGLIAEFFPVLHTHITPCVLSLVYDTLPRNHLISPKTKQQQQTGSKNEEQKLKIYQMEQSWVHLFECKAIGIMRTNTKKAPIGHLKYQAIRVINHYHIYVSEIVT